MLSELLHYMTRNLPMRLIEVGGGPYLERYHVASLFGRRVWLHHFVRDDQERNVHDHPWSAASIILCGGYVEEIGEIDGDRMALRERRLRAGQVNLIRATTRHRICSVRPGTWTLMLVGKRHGRGWWFYRAGPDCVVARSQPYAETNPEWHRYAGNRATVYVSRRTVRLERLIDRLAGRLDQVEAVMSEAQRR